MPSLQKRRDLPGIIRDSADTPKGSPTSRVALVRHLWCRAAELRFARTNPQAFSSLAPPAKDTAKAVPFAGGAKGIRTPDLLNAIQTRYQLRYNPVNMIIQERAHKNQAFLRTNFLQFPSRPRSFFTTGLLPHSGSGHTRPGSVPRTPLPLPKPLHEERQRNV